MTPRDPVGSYFDALAERWDELAFHPRDRVRFVLDTLGDISGLSALDVGSGTGVLIEPLLGRVGPAGKVLALDIAPRMIGVSRGKHAAANLEFAVADFLEWERPPKYDLIIAYSCYPHFLDQGAFWRAARRNLAAGGRVLVAHIEGRGAINSCHGGCDPAISRPLAPVAVLARLAEGLCFETLASADDEAYYLLLAGAQ